MSHHKSNFDSDAQQTVNFNPILVQCWATVCDAGNAVFNKNIWVNYSCLLTACRDTKYTPVCVVWYWDENSLGSNLEQVWRQIDCLKGIQWCSRQSQKEPTAYLWSKQLVSVGFARLLKFCSSLWNTLRYPLSENQATEQNYCNVYFLWLTLIQRCSPFLDLSCRYSF